MRGIDVSGFNTITNYDKVAKAGVEFAIVKIIRKDLNPDKLFETHWKGFERANIPIQGVYNYSYATTVKKAKNDALRVLEVLNGRKTMVWLDVEDDCQKNLGHTLVEIINTYRDVIVGANLQFGVYTGLSFYNTYLKKWSDELIMPFWIARYPSSSNITIKTETISSKRPDIHKTMYGWQYSSKGLIDGIVGNVDLNEWYVALEKNDLESPYSVDKDEYITSGFLKEMAKILKTSESASSVLAKTVTINAKTNKNHATVTALERLMKEHGYYSGSIEADMGKTPIFGNGMAKATALYQSDIVGLTKPDSEWTKKGKSYKKALMLI